MAGDIKAIETNYMGCRFRSRLEARWAVFFDALGWNWQYEKEGFIIGHDKTIPWLPDFEITTPKGQNFYVEVKGDPNFFKDGVWFDHLDWHGGPPGFPDSSWHPGRESAEALATRKPIILLGDVPKVRDDTEIWVPVIFHHEGVHGHYCQVLPDGLNLVYDSRGCYTWDNLGASGGIDNFGVAVGWAQSLESAAVLPAIRAALGARFEHGEKPQSRRN
jgi:hypothetical protein